MKKKSTQAFREIMFTRDILRILQFKGAYMRFPYTWNGERRSADVHAKDIFKAIKWDKPL